MPRSIATLSIEDYGREIGKMSFYIPDLTGANFVATLASVDALVADIEPVILGKVRTITVSMVDEHDAAPVTDEVAQRETKWFVALTDTTEFLDVGGTINNPGYLKKFNVEIPTAELDTHLVANTEIADLTNGEMDALRDSLEATIKSPWNFVKATSTVQVDQIVFVARNT